MKKIVSIGESLVRLTFANKKNIYNNKISYFLGGDAMNVASQLGFLDANIFYISVFDFENAYYQDFKNHFKIFNIKIDKLVFGKGRIGLYFHTPQTEISNSIVYYDRLNTAYSLITDWKFNLNSFDFIQFSSITLMANKNLNANLLKSLSQINTSTKKIIFDLNFRQKLWKSYNYFKKIIDPFLKKTNILVGWISERQFSSFDKLFTLSQLKNELKYTLKKYQNIEKIISPFKYKIGDKTYVVAYGYDNGKYYITQPICYNPIYPIGSGDSFTGAYIFELLNGKNFNDCLEFARNAYAIKNIFEGDQNMATYSEIKNISNLNQKIER